jgi:hypothetical protein
LRSIKAGETDSMPLVRPRACDLSLILTFVPSCRSTFSRRWSRSIATPKLRRRDLYTAHSGSSFTWAGRLERGGCQNTLIIGFARYPVKPRCGQLPKGPYQALGAENSDFHRHALAIFHFLRSNPRRIRQEPQKLKEITDV